VTRSRIASGMVSCTLDPDIGARQAPVCPVLFGKDLPYRRVAETQDPAGASECPSLTVVLPAVGPS
jgi:hypothetical protein